MAPALLDTVAVMTVTIAYREAGEGPAVPSSSTAGRRRRSSGATSWPPIAAHNRVIAMDLPGFGGSDKPLGVRYDLALFERAIDGLLDALGIDELGLAVHDLGGPRRRALGAGAPGPCDAAGAAQQRCSTPRSPPAWSRSSAR